VVHRFDLARKHSLV